MAFKNPFSKVRESMNFANNSVNASVVKQGLSGGNHLRFGSSTKGINKNVLPHTSKGVALNKSSSLSKTVMNRTFSAARMTTFGVAALAMTSSAIMHGAMNRTSELMVERYLDDQRNVNNLMFRTRVGKSTGGRSLNIGNHTGLSLSLSRSRHG